MVKEPNGETQKEFGIYLFRNHDLRYILLKTIKNICTNKDRKLQIQQIMNQDMLMKNISMTNIKKRDKTGGEEVEEVLNQL